MGATAPAAPAAAGSPPGAKEITEQAGATDPVIEPTAEDEAAEEDEFEPNDLDAQSTASTSVTSSIFQHHFENGRRYHHYKNGRYPIPNDDTEQNREDMKHALHMELTDGKLFLAPIGDNPQRIIDLGTGTGIWATEVADQYPSAQVIGTDLSPIQSNWVPPNVQFLIDDFEDEWLNGDDFDLVHLRSIAPIAKDMPKLLRQSIEHTRPGGWVELQEFGGYILSDDDSLTECSLPKFFDLSAEAMAKFGAKFRIGNDLGPLMMEAGYTNVTLKTIKVPIGTWPKDKTLRLCGMYMARNLSDLLGVMASKPLLALGMSKAEAEVLAAKARQDMKNPAFHAYINYRIWTGQKPEE
ncbi:S-adenosyl-L-methionine-dependent methyltransferase [Thozetella sp. PMI_491]|nr:S-adenosyl-L-methionine-dependent methyltransferase [Thozetella sp. PMI_491]